MKVAAIQMRSGVSIPENIKAMDGLVREAAAAGAVYVQTPEMTGILQKNRKGLFSEIEIEENDLLVRAASQLASELGIWLHIGSHAIKVGEEKAANRAFLFSPDGTLIATYDKIHMFDVDLENGESWRESKVYEAGTSGVLAEAGDCSLGLSICYDIRFPHLYRRYSLAGASVLTAPSAFTRQTGEAHWHILMQARAVENGAFVISAAQGGDHADGRSTFGHSLIVNPWGRIIAELENDEPGILLGDLDLDEVNRARKRIPNLANSRDFVIVSPSAEAGSAA